MKTDMIILEGFASGINQGVKGIDSSTISHYVIPVIFKHLSIDKWIEIWSTRIRSRRILRDFIEVNSPESIKKNLVIFAKSMGVVEIYDALERHWNIIDKYNEIGLMCIDGHSKLLKDLFKPPYGKRRSFTWLDIWTNNKGTSKLTVFNFFQQNKWPHGAEFLGADYQNNLTGPEIDHFKIIKNHQTLDGIKAMCDHMISAGSSHVLHR